MRGERVLDIALLPCVFHEFMVRADPLSLDAIANSLKRRNVAALGS